MNMKQSTILFFCCAVTLLHCGCVRRTVTIDPEHRGSTPDNGKIYGGQAQGEQIDNKIIWIWQKEFRNPQ
jgi:hypothetical protein